MITALEVRSVPAFAMLGDAEAERLARHAADLRLERGEYAVHEGDGRCLCAVLEGETEVTKAIDGVERIVGRRVAGEIFGEVPLVLGTPFPAAMRGAGPCRIMRIEPRDFHAVAATAPELSAFVGALARDRIEGLQELAADEPQVAATVTGDRWDVACRGVRTFLDRNRISYEWVMPDDPNGRFPTVAVRGGRVLIQPELRALAQLLDLTTVPSQEGYDTVIIGGGPAGLAAAVYGASEGLSTLMIEREAPGGQAGTSSRIENYLGFPTGISGDELAGRALQQAKRFGAEILVTRQVNALDPDTLQLTLDGGEIVRTRSIILATGVSWRRLNVEGFERLTGLGIYYGAARSEASSLQGLDVFLIGAGNSAGQAAMYFSSYARTVTLVCRGEALEKSMSHYLVEQLRSKHNVLVRVRSEVSAVRGDDHLESLDIRDAVSGATESCDAAALYVFIGADAETAWLPASIGRDKFGFIMTGDDVVRAGCWPAERDPYLLETSVPGIFACGDVRSRSVKRVAAGVGEGSMSIAFVHQFLANAS
ncbi:MAG TPA: FAD-dependent oxidoreductase [Candidatus Lustribacter sp.]|jgi:thioredoxin reductase (NADPH)|nr:FAD-dependent oxidoreductase [Candidatus Lustribacter sp.]